MFLGTDAGEIMFLLETMLVMTYKYKYKSSLTIGQKLHPWEMKTAIVRNRTQLLLSKMYFNYLENGAPKTYYIDETVLPQSHISEM